MRRGLTDWITYILNYKKQLFVITLISKLLDNFPKLLRNFQHIWFSPELIVKLSSLPHVNLLMQFMFFVLWELINKRSDIQNYLLPFVKQFQYYTKDKYFQLQLKPQIEPKLKSLQLLIHVILDPKQNYELWRIKDDKELTNKITSQITTDILLPIMKMLFENMHDNLVQIFGKDINDKDFVFKILNRNQNFQNIIKEVDQKCNRIRTEMSNWLQRKNPSWDDKRIFNEFQKKLRDSLIVVINNFTTILSWNNYQNVINECYFSQFIMTLHNLFEHDTHLQSSVSDFHGLIKQIHDIMSDKNTRLEESKCYQKFQNGFQQQNIIHELNQGRIPVIETLDNLISEPIKKRISSVAKDKIANRFTQNGDEIEGPMCKLLNNLIQIILVIDVSVNPFNNKCERFQSLFNDETKREQLLKNFYNSFEELCKINHGCKKFNYSTYDLSTFEGLLFEKQNNESIFSTKQDTKTKFVSRQDIFDFAITCIVQIFQDESSEFQKLFNDATELDLINTIQQILPKNDFQQAKQNLIQYVEYWKDETIDEDIPDQELKEIFEDVYRNKKPYLITSYINEQKKNILISHIIKFLLDMCPNSKINNVFLSLEQVFEYLDQNFQKTNETTDVINPATRNVRKRRRSQLNNTNVYTFKDVRNNQPEASTLTLLTNMNLEEQFQLIFTEFQNSLTHDKDIYKLLFNSIQTQKDVNEFLDKNIFIKLKTIDSIILNGFKRCMFIAFLQQKTGIADDQQVVNKCVHYFLVNSDETNNLTSLARRFNVDIDSYSVILAYFLCFVLAYIFLDNYTYKQNIKDYLSKLHIKISPIRFIKQDISKDQKSKLDSFIAKLFQNNFQNLQSTDDFVLEQIQKSLSYIQTLSMNETDPFMKAKLETLNTFLVIPALTEISSNDFEQLPSKRARTISSRIKYKRKLTSRRKKTSRNKHSPKNRNKHSIRRLTSRMRRTKM
jgi:hypothetical protein